LERGKEGVRGERKEKEVKGENEGRKEGDKGKGVWRNGKRGILCSCDFSFGIALRLLPFYL